MVVLRGISNLQLKKMVRMCSLLTFPPPSQGKELEIQGEFGS